MVLVSTSLWVYRAALRLPLSSWNYAGLSVGYELQFPDLSC